MKHASAWSVLARILAILLAILFVATAIAALVLFNLEHSAFDPRTYRRALIQARFYQQVPAMLGKLLARNLGQTAPALAQHITAEQWKVLIEALLPEAQLQPIGEEAIGQILGYLNGEVRTPSLSLLPLKRNLAGPRGLAAVMNLIQSQPPCTPQQVASLLTSPAQELCSPPQEMLDMFRPLIQAQLQSLAATLPDSIPLMANSVGGSPEALLQRLRLVRLVMRLSPLVPLVWLFGITLLVVRSLRDWLKWWGWPFLLAGLPVSGAPFLQLLLERRLARRLAPELPAEVLRVLQDLAGATLRQVLVPIGREGLALAIIGAVMIIAAYLIARREQRARLARSEAKTQVF